NRRADANPPAQLATVHPVLLKQHYKLMPLRHDRLLRPRHPSPSPTGQQCRYNASTMSPNTRPLSLPSIHTAGEGGPRRISGGVGEGIANPIDAHRPGDVFHLLLAQILKAEG